MIKTTSTVDQVKEVFEQVTYMDLSNVDLNASLEDDLGIDMDSDFPRIVAQLRKQFHLSADAEELLLDTDTLKHVVDIIADEVDLA
jgi:acyl carrier protein